MNESSRQERIIRTSVVGILVNLLIAAVKIMIGTLASSIAIVSEGINNATDAGSSFLTYIGTKLSGKHPDEKHPFGYGRIEYLTGMVVGVLILYAGLGMLKESVEGILHPSDMNVSILTVLIVAGTAVTKFILGMYTIKVGKSVESEVLLAVGEDGRNDSYFSGLTILSSVIFLFTGFSLDAYAGIVFSFVVIKSGVDTLKNTASDLIGRSGKEELARKLYKEIRATDGVISAICHTFFFPVSHLKIIFQRKPGCNIRLVMLDQSLHLIQGMHDLRFHCLFSFQFPEQFIQLLPLFSRKHCGQQRERISFCFPVVIRLHKCRNITG